MPQHSNVRSTLREARESFREAAQESEIGQRLSDMYDQSRVWIQDNYGKTIGIVAVVAALGALGYFLGKNGSRSMRRAS